MIGGSFSRLSPVHYCFPKIQGWNFFIMDNGKRVFSTIFSGFFLLLLCSQLQAIPPSLFRHHSVVTLPVINQYQGDAILVGGRVSLQQDRHKDVLVVGGDTQLGGTIQENAMVLSGKLSMSAKVGEDAVLVAGKAIIEPESVMRKDVYLLGGDITVRGTVKGDLYIFGGRVILDAKVQGDVYVVAGAMTIAESTEIRGSLSYLTPLKPIIPPGAVVKGELMVWGKPGVVDSAAMVHGDFSQILGKHDRGSVGRGFPNILFHLGIAVIAMFAAIFCAGFSRRSLGQMCQHPWLSGFTGIFAVVLIPIAAFLLLITAVGAPMALVLFAAYFVALWFAYALGVYAIGMAGLKLLKQEISHAPLSRRLLAVLFGMVLIILLSHIPYVGGWIPLIIFLGGFGALLRTLFTIQVEDKA